jgi:RimJ/RimL family protein N-acetyltransferase
MRVSPTWRFTVLTGSRVALRAVRREDVEALYPEFDTDPDLHAVTDRRPWRPVSLERALADHEKGLAQDSAKFVGFAVQQRGEPACIGYACLWGIEEHQRFAHLGITLTASTRGQGFGREALDLLCRYGFQVRDLYRLQLETLATNLGMQAVAKACGFVQEGRLRQHSWVMGHVIFGLLAPEWRPLRE